VALFFLYVMWLASDEGRKLHGLWVMIDDYMILGIINQLGVPWPCPVKETLKFQDWLNLNIDMFKATECQVAWASYDVKLYLYVFTPPFMVMGILLGGHLFIKWLKYKYSKEKYQHRTYTNWKGESITPTVSKRNYQIGMRWGTMTRAQAVACLFYVLQIQLMKQCLNALDCVPVNGKLVVYFARNIPCSGSDYAGLQAVAYVGIVVYGISVTCFFAYVVNFKTGGNKERRHKDGRLSMWTRVGSIAVPSDLDGTPNYQETLPGSQYTFAAFKDEEGEGAFMMEKTALADGDRPLGLDELHAQGAGVAVAQWSNRQSQMDDWLKGLTDGQTEEEVSAYVLRGLRWPPSI
jgi:hypothetical protein